MSVEKYWAYLDENSHNKINAREVLELEGREPGRWKHNRVYYSTHLPGQRLLMWHRRSHTGTCSFVYQPGCWGSYKCPADGRSESGASGTDYGQSGARLSRAETR